MKITHPHTRVLALTLLMACLSACNKPGPAQEAGRQLDESAEKASQAVKKTIDDVDDATQREKNKVSTALDDTEITAKVKTALLQREGLTSVTISVQTHQSVVTLTGSVTTQAQADLAKQLAAAVKGVNGVDNQLVVVAPAAALNKAQPN